MHTQTRHAVGVIGASGYSGVELTRILANHPNVELKLLASDRWVGETVEKRLQLDGALGRLRYSPLANADAFVGGLDVVLLATPAEASLELAPKLLARGVKVVDLSGAFRLTDAALYPAHYGFTHGHANLLGEAVYGQPERNRDAIRSAKLVANPGCFPTAATLALAPLLNAKLLANDRLIIDACSGVTGAGRKATEEYSFGEIDGDFRAYKVLRHQHTPEISQVLGGANVTFTAHLLPLKRGILATCHAQLAPGTDAGAVMNEYARAYAGEPFVRVLGSADEVGLKAVVGTNRCLIGASVSGDALVVTSAIDNLVKGAAGQAVQNLNLMLGLEETTGLLGLRAFNP